MSGDSAVVRFHWFVLGAFHFPLWRWLTKHPSKKMKTANQIYVDNKALTLVTCSNCGAETKVNGTLANKKVERALNRNCRTCNPPSNPYKDAWWKQFGLDKNPYVYGPMPRLRTSQRYRIEEARRMGWMAWTWQDEYKDERKGSSVKPQKK